ncbi:M50 family metallopeptidase [Amycolatopsis japonica]
MGWLFGPSETKEERAERLEREDRITRRATAYHEGGHAVALKLAGGTVKHVKVHANGRQGGTRTVEDGPGGRISELGWMVMLLAGAEAEYRYLTREAGLPASQAKASIKAGSQTDMSDLRNAVKAYGISEATVRSKTKSLINSNWGRITKVAVKLDERGTLRHGDI